VTSPSLDRADRLFVPLNTKHYRAFADGSKTWELRGVNNQFNENTVRVGRTVELRRGYSTDDSLWGVIRAVETFSSVDALVEGFPYEHILPGADEAEFRASVSDLLDQYDEFIVFGVTICKSSRR